MCVKPHRFNFVVIGCLAVFVFLYYVDVFCVVCVTDRHPCLVWAHCERDCGDALAFFAATPRRLCHGSAIQCQA